MTRAPTLRQYLQRRAEARAHELRAPFSHVFHEDGREWIAVERLRLAYAAGSEDALLGPETVNARDAASILGVHPNTIYNWMNAGHMAYRPIGAYRRPLRSEVLRYADARR